VQVLDFLQALFSCPEQALVASLLPTDYFVHLHSLGFLRAYHALPGAAGQSSGVKRVSASGSGGQPQLQLCMGHLKASPAAMLAATGMHLHRLPGLHATPCKAPWAKFQRGTYWH
jgi:hypothetical protein